VLCPGRVIQSGVLTQKLPITEHVAQNGKVKCTPVEDEPKAKNKRQCRWGSKPKGWTWATVRQGKLPSFRWSPRERESEGENFLTGEKPPSLKDPYITIPAQGTIYLVLNGRPREKRTAWLRRKNGGLSGGAKKNPHLPEGRARFWYLKGGYSPARKGGEKIRGGGGMGGETEKKTDQGSTTRL